MIKQWKIVSLCLLLGSCQEKPFTPFEEIPSEIELITGQPTYADSTGISITGTAAGPADIIQDATVGHCWSLQSPPTIEDDTSAFMGTTYFSLSIPVPYNNHPIYFRSYAIDGKGNIKYGTTEVFTYQSGKWYILPDVDFSGVDGGIGLQVGDVLYTGTGFIKPDKPTKSFYSFDFQTGQWAKLPDFPGAARGNATAFVIDDNIFVGAGSNNLFPGENDFFSDFYCFNLSDKSWKQVSNFPGTPRMNAQGVTVNGLGYLLGGYVSATEPLGDIWAYNSQQDKWTEQKTFPGTFRFSAFALVVNGAIYYGAGGRAGAGFDDIWKYDPGRDEWENTSFTIPGGDRGGMFAFSITGKGYLGGGYTGNNPITYFTDFYEFDPQGISVIAKQKIPHPRVFGVGFNYQQTGYAVSGTIAYDNPTKAFWKYIP